jgi:hypothetical protein
VNAVRRVWLSAGLVAAVGALALSVVLAIGQARAARPFADAGMMTGSGQVGSGAAMMGGTGTAMSMVWLVGDGHRVTSIQAARDRAAKAATGIGLHPGEVIWFDNGFYVELKDRTGAPATEVIVEPNSGTVSTEPGPAMMWNTRYGMRHNADGTNQKPAVSLAQARQAATAWLSANLPGRTAQPPDAYPGYYTLETTTSGGTVNGMLSVNAATGQVWYHSWHGRYLAKEDS